MGKNVLILGASGDIGMAIAKELAADGHQLLLHYYQNEKPIINLKKQFKDQIISIIQANLASDTDVEKLMMQIVFPVDMIIFASGHAYYGLLQDMTEETINKMITLHVKAPVFITKSLLPQMIRRRFGKIIF